MNAQQARQRAERLAQGDLARRLLAEMDRPAAPAAPSHEGHEELHKEIRSAAFDAWLSGSDEPEGHYHEPKVTYTVLALMASVEVDRETGCWLWTGEFADDRKGDDSRQYPVTVGSHQMCGIAHMWVARPFMEEFLGRVLDPMETVWATCETNAGQYRPCVAPTHHRVLAKENR
jgi:hypothetical protein